MSTLSTKWDMTWPLYARIARVFDEPKAHQQPMTHALSMLQTFSLDLVQYRASGSVVPAHTAQWCFYWLAVLSSHLSLDMQPEFNAAASTPPISDENWLLLLKGPHEAITFAESHADGTWFRLKGFELTARSLAAYATHLVQRTGPTPPADHWRAHLNVLAQLETES